MREIKFRVWNPRKKVMASNFGEINTVGEDVVGEVVGGRLKAYYMNVDHWAEAPLMQFTGLKDKNGTEIYEGDILQVCEARSTTTLYRMEARTTEWESTFKHKVELTPSNFQLTSYYTRCANCEVIGNIHENSELL